MNEPLASPYPRFHIDSPRLGAAFYRQRIPIEGWIHLGSAQHTIRHISAHAHQQELGATSHLFPRADVSAALGLPISVPTGFRLLACFTDPIGADLADIELRVHWPMARTWNSPPFRSACTPTTTPPPLTAISAIRTRPGSSIAHTSIRRAAPPRPPTPNASDCSPTIFLPLPISSTWAAASAPFTIPCAPSDTPGPAAKPPRSVSPSSPDAVALIGLSLSLSLPNPLQIIAFPQPTTSSTP